MKDRRRRVSLTNALKAAVLVLGFAAGARWIGFTGTEIVSFLGIALMLAGMFSACGGGPRSLQ